jgi:hypothetical protein
MHSDAVCLRHRNQGTPCYDRTTHGTRISHDREAGNSRRSQLALRIAVLRGMGLGLPKRYLEDPRYDRSHHSNLLRPLVSRSLSSYTISTPLFPSCFVGPLRRSTGYGVRIPLRRTAEKNRSGSLVYQHRDRDTRCRRSYSAGT